MLVLCMWRLIPLVMFNCIIRVLKIRAAAGAHGPKAKPQLLGRWVRCTVLLQARGSLPSPVLQQWLFCNGFTCAVSLMAPPAPSPCPQ